MYSFDLLLAEHGAPVLAGIKTANLITCQRAWYPDLPQMLAAYQRAFAGRGVCFRILCACDYRFLLLVYRPARLLEDLASREARALLSRYGYPMEEGLDALLDHLSRRTADRAEFPHEIGLFLGYPLCDVLGYIKNRGQNSKLTGWWQVYGDEAEAARLFSRFRKCRDVYSRLWSEGRSVQQLTVCA